MKRRIAIWLSTVTLLTTTTLASAQPIGGSLTNVRTGLIVLAIAGCLLLTLILRPTVAALLRSVNGKLGRRRIAAILRSGSKDVLDDFILPGAYGGLTRVDHAVMTAGGILCIQAKHYNGVVFGEPDDPQWTHVDGVRRRRFLNPQIQNEGRTNALRKIVPEVPVANLVVFTGSVEFTNARDKNVIHVRDLESYIAKFEFGPSPIEDWDAVWLTVQSAALTDDESRKDFDAQLSFG